MECYGEIVKIALQYPDILEVRLFGSRARGDNHPRSDIDLAVFTKNKEFSAKYRFLDQLEELPSLLAVDVTFVRDSTDLTFLENIRREGVSLMKKTSKKENFSKALARLKEGLEDFEKNPCDIIRDGVIQRFEFTAELAWKACKEYLEQAGHKVEGSPKPILRKAYEIGLISQEETWIDLISARNHTSHLYEEKVAVEILGEIQVRFLGVLEMLGERLAQG